MQRLNGVVNQKIVTIVVSEVGCYYWIGMLAESPGVDKHNVTDRRLYVMVEFGLIQLCDGIAVPARCVTM